MTRDNDERLNMFVDLPSDYGEIEIRRIALNMDQVENFRLAPNPAKITDSRFNGYATLHGSESWELDALDPTVIDNLIRDELENVRDPDAWDRVESEETQAQRLMQSAANRWSEVIEFLTRPNYE
jgi:hypothetical protein